MSKGHEWVPFTEDMVICSQCGDVCDEAVPEHVWNEETCEPDGLLATLEDWHSS